MKFPIAAAALLLLPLAANAQDTPDPRIAAQEVVRAEIARWHFPLVEGERRYPHILGTNTLPPLTDLCVSSYTISFPAFRDGNTDHPVVTRPVPMEWRNAGRPARREGNIVILNWRARGARSTSKIVAASNSEPSYDWRLDMETTARATAFTEAANVLANACTAQPLMED